MQATLLVLAAPYGDIWRHSHGVVQMVMGRPIRVDVAEDRSDRSRPAGLLLSQ